MASKVSEAMEPKRGYRKVHHVEVEPIKGEHGGHIVTRHFHQGNGPHQPEPQVFGKSEGAAALAHIAKHAGIEHTMEPEDNIDNE